MKLYLQTEPNPNGTTHDQENAFWEVDGIPDGWAELPTGLYPVWEQYKPFVMLTVVDGVITGIADNAEARANQPASEPAEPDAQTDILSMAVDHEYRLTLLELGV